MIVNIYPYLMLNGNALEAVKFYEEALSAEVLTVRTYGDMPPQPDQPPIPEEMRNRVMHAHLKVGETDFMMSDTIPGEQQLGSLVTIAITVADVDTAHAVFEKLQAGGKVIMPLQETFWSPAYGQVTDRYGVTWQLSTMGPDQLADAT